MPLDAISTYNGMVIIGFYQLKSTNRNQTQDFFVHIPNPTIWGN
jgi:hypothetical protein